jgi:hypothetical protein
MLPRSTGAGGGSSKKSKKPAAKPSIKSAVPKTGPRKAAPTKTTYTRTTGGKGFKGTTKPTVATKTIVKGAKEYIPSAKAIKDAAKSVPSTAKAGLKQLVPDWKLPGGGKNTGDWAKAEKYMDKVAPSPKKTAKKVQTKKNKIGGR